MRRSYVVSLAVIIVILVAVGSYVIVYNPFVPRFKATLTQRGTGDSLTWWTDRKHTKVLYANITFTFTSPGTLDPSKLNLTISKPGEKIAFDSSGTLLDAIPLVYSSGQFPHWLAIYEMGYWSGFTGTMLNPDESIVGGTLNQPVQGDRIESGAILTLTFPSSVNSTQGYVLAASYEGASGNATITLEA
jgi:hypothetical protein